MHAKDMIELCQPLFSKGFIQGFWHGVLDEQKHTLTLLTTTPECEKAILDAGLAPQDSELKEGIHYLPFCLQSQRRVEINKAFAMHNILEIVRCKDNKKYLYGFATQEAGLSVVNHFFNSLDQFNQFINHFNDHATKLIESAKSDSINLKPSLQTKGLSQKALFSAREEQILSHLCQGHTSKQIARAINISHRTVEDYLNNIKSKLGVRSREEVIYNYLIMNSHS